jgi:hypothetical protein
MVEDANLAPDPEPDFTEATPYAMEGMPDLNYPSAVEEGEQYESELARKEAEIKKSIEERTEREKARLRAEEEAAQKKIMDDMQRDIERDKQAQMRAAAEAQAAREQELASKKPYIPPPVGIPPPSDSTASASELFSPIKPPKVASTEEPSTRFYMQDVRGGEKVSVNPGSG